MSEISWMVYGQRSERTYVSDPNGDTASIAEALDRLDSTPPPKRGLFGRKKPAADDAVEAESHAVRVAQPGVVEAVHAILTVDPAQDQRVHDLAWRISATEDVDGDPDAAAAADELFELQEQLDPES